LLDFLLNFSFFADTIGLAIAFLITFLLRNNNFIAKRKNIILLYFFSYLLLSLYGNLYPNFYYWFRPFYPVNSNNWLYDNIPLILSFILFIFFYKLSESKTANLTCKFSFLLVLTFYIVTWRNAINRDPNLEYYLVYTVFIILNSVVYLLVQLNNLQSDSLFDKGEFWFISSIVFYSSSCSLFWVFFKDIYTNYPTFFNKNYLWSCHNVILFISCIVYSSAIYLKTRQPR
jgi:hypothetical protein